MRTSPADGLLVLDKPAGITSRAALNRLQRWFPRGTRVGHTGTLDPLATGVLVVCLGSATRLAEYVQAMSKEYVATFHLGAGSSTDDADGEITPIQAEPPPLEQVRAELERFVGAIEQVPPQFSAALVAGERAHDLARQGEAVDLAPRRVRIYQIGILDFNYPLLQVRVHCGKGTYIRSLARDLGQALGCGAYVATLRRTRVGPFRAEQALPLTEEPPATLRLLPLTAAVAELPRLVLPAEPLRRFRHGQKIHDRLLGQHAAGAELAVFGLDGSFAGIGRLTADGLLAPVKVLARPG